MHVVIDTAQANHWLVYHTHRSQHSAAGFPDLVCVRGTRLVVCELKRVGQAPTMDQVRWLLALARVDGVEVFCWDPTDVDAMMAVLA
jgi:hypothetical protein